MPISTYEDGPPLSLFIFFLALLFLSGFVWMFCGTCVGRDAARACGLGKYVPKDDGEHRRSRRRTRGIRTLDELGQESWEMLEEGSYADDETWNSAEDK
jgi:hypothetical protein